MSGLEEIGLDLDAVAVTAHRVFCLSLDQDADGEVNPAWAAVAKHVVAMTETGDEDITLSVTQMAQMVRKEFARAADPDLEELSRFDALEPKVQNAWRAVVRHLLNVLSSDNAKKLNELEAAMADFAKAGFVRS